jgi:hypothetical protein
MTRTYPTEFKSKAAFLEWMMSRADSLAADLRRSSPPSTTRPEIDLRLQMASLLQCADFVLQLSEAAAAVAPSRQPAPQLEYIALDVGHMRSEGYFEALQEAGTLIMRKPPLQLPFAISRAGSEQFQLRLGEPGAAQALEVAVTHPSFGGRRFWFVCPGFEGGCGNRVLRVYRTTEGGPFACHACHKAAHDNGWRTARDRHIVFTTIQHAS